MLVTVVVYHRLKIAAVVAVSTAKDIRYFLCKFLSAQYLASRREIRN